MNYNFFDVSSDKNLQDIFKSQFIVDLDRFKRNCSSLSDEQFISSGIDRVISQCKTGREFLQMSNEIFNINIATSTFSDAMHSPRRLDLVRQVANLNYQSLNQ